MFDQNKLKKNFQSITPKYLKYSFFVNSTKRWRTIQRFVKINPIIFVKNVTRLLPWPQKQCDFASITMVVPWDYLQMIWRIVFCLICTFLFLVPTMIEILQWYSTFLMPSKKILTHMKYLKAVFFQAQGSVFNHIPF